MCQCENCGWRNEECKKGCDAFNEIPIICNNWISIEERHRVEARIKRYEQRQVEVRSTINYVPLGGSCGKWMKGKKRLTSYGIV